MRVDIFYRKTFQGAWVLSTIHNGYRVQRQYMGYTKKEATRMFRDELKEGTFK